MVYYFQCASDSPTDLMPAGAICLSADVLVGEWGINVALSSDSGTHRFHSPPSRLCHTLNPEVQQASCAPVWKTVREYKKRERYRDRGKWKKGRIGMCSNLICSTWFDGIYEDVRQRIGLPIACWVWGCKSLQWHVCKFLLLLYFKYSFFCDIDWRNFIWSFWCCGYL